MAALAGLIGPEAKSDAVQAMLETMKHRGEDTARLHEAAGLSVGVRTAELSAARGDGFAVAGETFALIDGEIYNERPAGTSDAQVVLDAYRTHGRGFAGYLEGVFACVIGDGDECILARGPVGVRPMYWGTTADGHLCFASEMKGLVGRSEDVDELQPGTMVSTRTGVSAYLPRYPDVAPAGDLAAATRQVRETMMRAVQRRLEDGAVGACLLSGGLDSTIIACAAYELGARLPLVTVGVAGAPDVENAKIVAQQLGGEHHVEPFDADAIRQAVPRAVWALESFDEDCVSGAVSNLFASARARQMTNCILSGEGGDELFGGYHLLKDLATDQQRLRMMERLIEIAYNTAVQRLDRAMMGNGIQYRTPFIDTEVAALAMQLPVRWKIHGLEGDASIEKYILREAFRDLIPEPIYKRSKLRFAAGTGTDDLMDRVAESEVSDFNEQTRHTPEGYTLNSPKELWYYRLFKEAFPAPCFERLVGRWDPNK